MCRRPARSGIHAWQARARRALLRMRPYLSARSARGTGDTTTSMPSRRTAHERVLPDLSPSLSVMRSVDVPGADRRRAAHRPARISWAGLARGSAPGLSPSLIRSLIRRSSQASAKPRWLRSSQVTDGPGRARTLGCSLGKRVGGNPSGVRISYPPRPDLQEHWRWPQHTSASSCRGLNWWAQFPSREGYRLLMSAAAVVPGHGLRGQA